MEHITYIQRRLELWKKGSFVELLNEGCAIQKQLPNGSRYPKNNGWTKSFADLMFQGRTRDALHLLDQVADSAGQFLSLDTSINLPDGMKTVRDILVEKHPPPGPLSPDHVLLQSTPTQDHEPILFYLIN